MHLVVFTFFVALPVGSSILLVERWKNLDGSDSFPAASAGPPLGQYGRVTANNSNSGYGGLSTIPASSVPRPTVRPGVVHGLRSCVVLQVALSLSLL